MNQQNVWRYYLDHVKFCWLFVVISKLDKIDTTVYLVNLYSLIGWSISQLHNLNISCAYRQYIGQLETINVYEQKCLSSHNHDHQGIPFSTLEIVSITFCTQPKKLHKWYGSAIKTHFQMTNQQMQFKCFHKNYHFLLQIRKGRNLCVFGAYFGGQSCLSTAY